MIRRIKTRNPEIRRCKYLINAVKENNNCGYAIKLIIPHIYFKFMLSQFK